MLPPLDQRGLLPPGVHDATIDEISAAFGTNAVRAHLLAEFRRFLRERLIPIGAGLDLYVCGSFLSDKVSPGDIDCAIPVPVSSIVVHVNVLALLDDGRIPPAKGTTWDEYKVDVWPYLAGAPGNDFVTFFQYVGQKTATLKNLSVTDKRGIVKVDQWILG
jgi:hypothetical protein